MANKPELDTIDTPKAKQLSRSWLTTTGAVVAAAEAVVGAGAGVEKLHRWTTTKCVWCKHNGRKCLRPQHVRVSRGGSALERNGRGIQVHRVLEWDNNCLHKLKINVNRMHGTINRHPCAFPWLFVKNIAITTKASDGNQKPTTDKPTDNQSRDKGDSSNSSSNCSWMRMQDARCGVCAASIASDNKPTTATTTTSNAKWEMQHNINHKLRLQAGSSQPRLGTARHGTAGRQPHCSAYKQAGGGGESLAPPNQELPLLLCLAWPSHGYGDFVCERDFFDFQPTPKTEMSCCCSCCCCCLLPRPHRNNKPNTA